MIRRPLPILLLLYLAAWATDARAQANPDRSRVAPYGSVRVELDGGWTAASSTFTRNWEPRPILGLTLSTPFHAGELEAGIRYSRFRNVNARNDFSDFDALFLHLGWGMPVRLGGRGSLVPGLALGTTYLKYDRAMTYTNPGAIWSYTFDTRESEISYELSLEFRYRLVGNWGLFGGVSYNRTLTRHPLEMTLVRAGISHSLSTPKWLREFLQ